MRFKKVRDVKDPMLASVGAAGFDLYFPDDFEKITIHPKQTEKLLTGLCVEIPKFHVGFLLPRSSSGCAGLMLQNTCGVIDSDFRQEMQVRARNWSETEDLYICPGERFAQLIVVPCEASTVEIVKELPETMREGGFGSTGK